MARRKDSPQKAAMREMMRDYLKNNDISIKDGSKTGGQQNGYKPLILGQRLKALAFTMFKPLCS